MIPGRYDIDLHDGDSYRGPLIVLPSLAPFGGPADLSATTVRAQVRERPESEEVHGFAVEIVNPAARELRLSLSSEDVLALPAKGVWELEVSSPGFVGTVLSGYVTKGRQVTR